MSVIKVYLSGNEYLFHSILKRKWEATRPTRYWLDPSPKLSAVSFKTFRFHSLWYTEHPSIHFLHHSSYTAVPGRCPKGLWAQSRGTPGTAVPTYHRPHTHNYTLQTRDQPINLHIQGGGRNQTRNPAVMVWSKWLIKVQACVQIFLNASLSDIHRVSKELEGKPCLQEKCK